MTESSTTSVLDRNRLDALVKPLCAQVRTAIGPTVRDGAVPLAELVSAGQLPFAWDTQVEAGRHYRLVPPARRGLRAQHRLLRPGLLVPARRRGALLAAQLLPAVAGPQALHLVRPVRLLRLRGLRGLRGLRRCIACCPVGIDITKFDDSGLDRRRGAARLAASARREGNRPGGRSGRLSRGRSRRPGVRQRAHRTMAAGPAARRHVGQGVGPGRTAVAPQGQVNRAARAIARAAVGAEHLSRPLPGRRTRSDPPSSTDGQWHRVLDDRAAVLG